MKIRWLIPLLGSLALAVSCMKETTGEESRASAASGPWAVDGAALKSTTEEIRKSFGEPDEINRRTPQRETWKWNITVHPLIIFNTESDPVACEILGMSLTDRSGKRVIDYSTPESDIPKILPGVKIEKRYTSTGSGVISIGRKHTGTGYTITDADGTYLISYREGSLVNVLAR